MTRTLPYLLSFILIIAFSAKVYSQNFIPGKITTINGDTIEGKIDFNLWPATPKKISFKFEGKSKPYKVAELAGFEVYRVDGYTEVYVSKTVNIDTSNQFIGQFSKSELPEFAEKTLFLKVIVSGQLSLYAYKDLRSHFFVENETGEIEELIHRKFEKKVGYDWKIGTSNLYRAQLQKITAACQGLVKEDIPYRLSKLKKIVLAYEKCKNHKVNYAYTPQKSRPSFYASLGSGLSSYSWGTDNKKTIKPVYSLGIGFDFPMRKKVSYLLEIDLKNRGFKDSNELLATGDVFQSTSFDYSNLILGVGNFVRYHLYLEPSKLIFSGGFQQGIALHSSGSVTNVSKFYTSYTETTNEVKLTSPEFSFIMGVAYHYKRSGAEFRLEGSSARFKGLSTSWTTFRLSYSYRINKYIYKINPEKRSL